MAQAAADGQGLGAILAAIEHRREDIVLPGWLGLPARLNGGVPALYRRLQRLQGTFGLWTAGAANAARPASTGARTSNSLPEQGQLPFSQCTRPIATENGDTRTAAASSTFGWNALTSWCSPA